MKKPFRFRSTLLLIASIIFLALPASPLGQTPPAARKSWFFAVSGDSRDCGDLIMPKMARDIVVNNHNTPVEFYWHLGDYRALYRPDCDIVKLKYPSFDCSPDKNVPNNDPQWNAILKEYLPTAWDDFIKHQVKPFGSTPVFLGIGNHELINHTRNDYRATFKKWLGQETLQTQVRIDRKRGIESEEGNTYFHFIRKGVDFIYLDNADNNSFSPQQLQWLMQVLNADAKDDSIKTIIAGMHAALPQSTSSNHGMDASCEGFCSGLLAYNLLYKAQNLQGPSVKRKKVYVLASHSHYFRKNIYEPGHKGQVLPGWIIGTAGAEQYKEKDEPIVYGYLLVEVHPNGTITTKLREVDKDSPPQLTGTGADELTSFCFKQNKQEPAKDHNPHCDCGGSK